MNRLYLIVILLAVITTSACDLVQKAPESADIHWMINAPSDLSPSTFKIDKIYRDTILSFEKLHPSIKVTLDYFPQTQDFDFMKMIKGDQSPDIIPFGFFDLEGIDKDGLFVDLLGLVPNPKDIDIDKRILDSVKFHEKLYVLPYSFSPLVVLYNKNLFDDIDEPYPENDWTWEQFRSISNKMLPGQGSDIAYDTYTFEALAASKGTTLMASDGSTFVGYLDSPESVEALKWLNAYYHDDTLKSGPRDPTVSGTAFNYGKKSMVIGDLEAYAFYKTSLGEALGVASLPHFEGGKRVNPLSYLGFGISNKSKNPQAAWEFLNYLTLTNQEHTAALTQSYLTTSKSIGLAIHQDTDPIKSILANEINYAIKPQGYVSPKYYQAQSPEIYTQFQDLLNVDDNDVQDKLHDLALKLDKELDRLKTTADQ
ncbi:extracellular solute-binding protein [Paenibacillus psychroresistens]|uniref:Extracellular solute-binding protein n=1 Tax=Paenibacillus psychroresistens TaxID=1778678 RepID=A0A6B8RTS5_9BACL|nr:extracellular solute-binding protein [Paenibacillus psychroresistens]QGQ99309.1 extracellular solute-binding protein [Paenibacillus psychroresistens]